MSETKEITSAVEKVTEEEKELAAKTLSGDVAQEIIGMFKSTEDWKHASQNKQLEKVQYIHEFCESITRRMAKIIAASDRTVILANIDSATAKNGMIKVVCTCPKTEETALNIVLAEGSPILLTVSNEDNFVGAKLRSEDHTDPDQPSFINDLKENEGATVHVDSETGEVD